MRLSLLFAIILLFGNPVDGQEKSTAEVFIIGTMHDVPKIVKNAYRPLRKMAIKYQPDAIYTEHSMSTDTLSINNYYSDFFVPYSDSIAQIFEEDPARTSQLEQRSIKQMSQDDFDYLRHYYAAHVDMANWRYFTYLRKYGIKGSKKPLRHENYDLTAKTAIAMNMSKIYSMDHQHETKAYSKNWKKCLKVSREDGQIALLEKHNKKDYRKHILPGLFGRLGKYSNKKSTIKRYQVSNRFTFRTSPCAPCEEGARIWDRRNAGMAKNIGEQVNLYQHKKALVVVGASHVLGIKAELEKQYPDLQVRIIDQ